MRVYYIKNDKCVDLTPQIKQLYVIPLIPASLELIRVIAGSYGIAKFAEYIGFIDGDIDMALLSTVDKFKDVLGVMIQNGMVK